MSPLSPRIQLGYTHVLSSCGFLLPGSLGSAACVRQFSLGVFLAPTLEFHGIDVKQSSKCPNHPKRKPSSVVMRCFRDFTLWKLAQQCLALKISPCRLHSCGLGWYFAFQCFPFCMGTKGVSHLPTNVLFFKKEYEASSILSRMYLDKNMYLQKWSIRHLGKTYFIDSLWGQNLSIHTGKWLVVSQGFHVRNSMFHVLFASLQLGAFVLLK